MQTETALLITLGVVLVLNPVVKHLMSRLGLPAPVGYIALGFLISALDKQLAFIDATFAYVFSVLAQLGVVALLFRVGLRSHLKALIAKLPDASLIWLGDVAANLVIGFVLARYALGLSLETALAIATAFSATSVAVSVAVWDELKLLNSGRGTLLLDVAELDDLSGVLLLTILVAILPVLQTGDGDLLGAATSTAGMTLLKLAGFIVICYLFSRYAEENFTRFNRRFGGDGNALVITILGTGLAISAFAELLGFSVAIGALFAGLAFSRDPAVVHSEGRFSFFYEFFAPLFFINIGMQVDPATFVVAAELGLVLFAAAAAAKLIGVTTPALLLMPRSDALVLGVSMIPRAEIALLVIYQCTQINADIVPPEIFAAVVVASILTSTLAPLLTRWLLVRKNRKT